MSSHSVDIIMKTVREEIIYRRVVAECSITKNDQGRETNVFTEGKLDKHV